MNILNLDCLKSCNINVSQISSMPAKVLSGLVLFTTAAVVCTKLIHAAVLGNSVAICLFACMLGFCGWVGYNWMNALSYRSAKSAELASDYFLHLVSLIFCCSK